MSAPIAVIGLAGRFADAPDAGAFWRGLCAGREFVRTLSDADLAAAEVDPAELAAPGYVRRRAVLADADLFAASFFGITPREAEVTDPQHRVFLECAWEALEDAGYDAARYDGAIAVFAGASPNLYGVRLYADRELRRALGATQSNLASAVDYLTTRVSYKLGLRGPSVVVQTACSTSLVAVHTACQSLLNGECDMAMAGGVSIHFPQGGYHWQEGSILSPDGRCRAFDAAAQGTSLGSGAGVVVLKRLSDALSDGDHVRAVVLGSAMNNDGSEKVGFTAPSVDGQADVIAEAQALAGVDARSIGYVEAHGTGTSLGDPIEVQALTRVFRESTGERGYCALGSVKTNVGHLDAAAGVAGLIKAVLSLEHGQVPPSLHFERGNPGCELEESPFFVNTGLLEWERREGEPRRAGVSAFGLGGTNAHVVLEEAPERESSGPGREVQLLLLSARTGGSLERAGERLREHLVEYPEQVLADVAYTLQVGRRQLERRRAVVCGSLEEAVGALGGGDPGRVVSGQVRGGRRGVVFLFPGQGAQHVGMGRELYEREGCFRGWMERCAEGLGEWLGEDLLEALYGEGASEERLQQTRLAQPALFAVEYALARQWMEWGVSPVAMIGHSLGEYVAACLSGVLGLEDSLRLVAARGRLMQGMPGGSMLSVQLGLEELEGRLGGEVGVAAVNGPRQVVVSGPSDAVRELEEELEREGVGTRRLQTSHAFHSSMLEPVVGELVREVGGVRLGEPGLAYVSNVSGGWARGEEVCEAGYWGRQLREPVRFWSGLELVSREEGVVLLEVGPQNALSGLARQLGEEGPPVYASMRYRQDRRGDQEVLVTALGQLWATGVEVDWRAYTAGERRRRVPLPTYPFERGVHWVDRTPAPQAEPDGEPADDFVIAEAAEEDAWEDAADGRIPPRTDLELVIATAMQTHLGFARVGIQENFFALGGHSLMALGMVGELRERLGTAVDLRLLFEHPTVESLAEAITELRRAEAAEREALLAEIERLSVEEAEALLRLAEEEEARV